MLLRTLRLVVPAVWIGLVGGLAFIETPLKFLAPGVTTELALGIGRLVLTAAEIAGLVLLVGMTLLALPRPRPSRAGLAVIGALWVIALALSVVVRPMLNARTDVVLAGGDPGGSPLHVVYIVIDLVLLATLVVAIVVEARAQRAVAASPLADGAPAAASSSAGRAAT